MAFSQGRIVDALARLPFIDAGELALVLGEPLATVHRALSGLLNNRIAGRVSHGTGQLPSSRRCRCPGVRRALGLLPAYPASRQWLARLCVVRQGLALRRRSLYNRLRAIAEYHHSRRPSVILEFDFLRYRTDAVQQGGHTEGGNRQNQLTLNRQKWLTRDTWPAGWASPTESQPDDTQPDANLGLVEPHGKRGNVRYTLSDRGIGYITRWDRAQLATTMAAWSTEPTVDNHGRSRPLGHRILTWARQTAHADGIAWFLPELAAEARADDGSELQRPMPPLRAGPQPGRGGHRSRPGGTPADRRPARALLLRVRAARPPPRGRGRLRPYIRYYRSDTSAEDQPPFPTTLFMVDTEEVAETYASAAFRMPAMSLPILVSSREFCHTGGYWAGSGVPCGMAKVRP